MPGLVGRCHGRLHPAWPEPFPNGRHRSGRRATEVEGLSVAPSGISLRAETGTLERFRQRSLRGRAKLGLVLRSPRVLSELRSYLRTGHLHNLWFSKRSSDVRGRDPRLLARASGAPSVVNVRCAACLSAFMILACGTGNASPAAPAKHLVCPSSGIPAFGGATGGTIASCGNGRVDQAGMTYEMCDGADLSGATCASLGFSGGSLSCAASCTYDTSACDICVVNKHVDACQMTGLGLRPNATSLSASVDGVDIAWATCGASDLEKGPGVHIARFDGALALLGEASVDEEPVESVSLVRSASGMVIAFAANDGVHVESLNAEAGPRGGSRIIPNAFAPTLIERTVDGNAAGGPLLLWAELSPSSCSERGCPNPPPAIVRGAVLDDDGREQAPAQIVFSDVSAPVPSSTDNTLVHGVFTGESFLVACKFDVSVAVAAVGLNGAVAPTELPIQGRADLPQLAWAGDEARLAYLSGAPTVARLSATGQLLAPPVSVGTLDSGGLVRVNALGKDTVLLARTSEAIELARGSQAGDFGIPYAIAAGHSSVPFDTVAIGGQLIASFLPDGGRLGLVLITP